MSPSRRSARCCARSGSSTASAAPACRSSSRSATGRSRSSGVTQTADGALKLVAAEGESIPGPTFRIGNTNSRLRLASPPAEFFERWCAEGPTHHVALGVGHRVEEVRRVAALLELPFAVVG